MVERSRAVFLNENPFVGTHVTIASMRDRHHGFFSRVAVHASW